MELIVPDQIIMGLILNAGDAKQHIYQALKCAKAEDYDTSEKEMALANDALLEAHNLQTQFLAQKLVVISQRLQLFLFTHRIT